MKWLLLPLLILDCGFVPRRNNKLRVSSKDSRKNVVYAEMNGRTVAINVSSKKHIKIGSFLTVKWFYGRFSKIIYVST